MSTMPVQKDFSSGQFLPNAFPNATPLPDYPIDGFPYRNTAPVVGNVKQQTSNFNALYQNQTPSSSLLPPTVNSGLSPRYGGRRRRRRGPRSLRRKSRKGKRKTRRHY